MGTKGENLDRIIVQLAASSIDTKLLKMQAYGKFVI